MLHRFLAVFAILVGSIAFAGTADAHISVEPPSTNQGVTTALTFRVHAMKSPTNKVVLNIPKETPLALLTILPLPGWTFTVEKGTLSAPLTNVMGLQVTEVITKITWTGGPIAANQYQEFKIYAGPLPDLAQIVFPLQQHSVDGTVFRYEHVIPPGQIFNPDEPLPVAPDGSTLYLAPVVKLSSGGGVDEHGMPIEQVVTTSSSSPAHGDDSKSGLLLVAIGASVTSALLSVAAIVALGPRSTDLRSR